MLNALIVFFPPHIIMFTLKNSFCFKIFKWIKFTMMTARVLCWNCQNTEILNICKLTTHHTVPQLLKLNHIFYFYVNDKVKNNTISFQIQICIFRLYHNGLLFSFNYHV